MVIEAGSGQARGCLVAYATRDGHSQFVAARIVDRLTANAIPARAHDLRTGLPAPAELVGASLVVLVAAVRYGHHLSQAHDFLAAHGNLARPPPLALASVNLTARKPAKSTAETNPYLRKLIARSGCAPVLAIAVAGRLDYPRYHWFDRAIIRAIMRLTGGPTDPRTSVVYTAWDAVDAFAARLAELGAHAGGCAAHARLSAHAASHGPLAHTERQRFDLDQ